VKRKRWSGVGGRRPTVARTETAVSSARKLTPLAWLVAFSIIRGDSLPCVAIDRRALPDPIRQRGKRGNRHQRR